MALRLSSYLAIESSRNLPAWGQGAWSARRDVEKLRLPRPRALGELCMARKEIITNTSEDETRLAILEDMFLLFSCSHCHAAILRPLPLPRKPILPKSRFRYTFTTGC